MEIDFSIKGLSSPLIPPMGPFCLSGGPFLVGDEFNVPIALSAFRDKVLSVVVGSFKVFSVHL